jgi:hypothetical protein
MQGRIESNRDTLVAVKRIQAILVIVALLASPLALLARGMSGDSGDCTRMCCLRHGAHSGAMEHATDSSSSDGMMCHRHAAAHNCECAMSPRQNSMDYGFLAPIAPTSPSAIVGILNPEVSREYFGRQMKMTLSGFLSAPFEPPRS